jgi:hypothetical protein
MRNSLISALALVMALAAAPAAQAGKAHSGQVTPGKAGVLSKAAQKLVGTWRMVAFEFGSTRRPFPGSMSYTVTLRSNGTLAMKNVPQATKFSKARWNVKGKYVLLTQKKKVEKLTYSLKANELTVAMPGKTKLRIIMQRVSTKTKP